MGAQNGSPRTLTGLKTMWPVWTPVLVQLFPARMKDAPRKLVGIERTLCTEGITFYFWTLLARQIFWNPGNKMFWQQFIDAVCQDRLILRAAKLQLFRFIAMYPQLFWHWEWNRYNRWKTHFAQIFPTYKHKKEQDRYFAPELSTSLVQKWFGCSPWHLDQNLHL